MKIFLEEGEKRILAKAFQNRKQIAVKQNAMANQTGFFRGKENRSLWAFYGGNN